MCGKKNAHFKYDFITYVALQEKDGRRPDGRALLEYRNTGLNIGELISLVWSTSNLAKNLTQKKQHIQNSPKFLWGNLIPLFYDKSELH